MSKGQEEAVYANERKIAVEAGAGAGKTWVLTNRYKRVLKEKGGTEASEILTLTFTDPAASEMKARIIGGIGEAEDFSELWISTIHSFAGKIIRESGLSLDIDPSAVVISSGQEQEFWEGIKRAVEFGNLRELARTYGNKNIRDGAKILDENLYMSSAVNKWKAERLGEFARKTAKLHASSGHTWEEMLAWSDDDVLIEKSRPLVENILADEWKEVWKIFERISLPEAKKTNNAGTALNDLLTWQKSAAPNIKELKYFYERLINNINKDITNNKGEPFLTFKEILGMSITDFRKSRPQLIKDITSDFEENILPEELQMRKILMKFCAVSWGMWDMMKKRRGLLSFSDMILHACRAINNKSVKREFSHILVDEFQDTDQLQFDMIEALMKNSENASLFVVGDPKQSIYKFRYADPSLFAKVINNSDHKITLDVSFRTRKKLLDKINDIFSSLWRDGLGKSDTMRGLNYKALSAAANAAERNLGSMPDFKIILSKNDNGLKDARKKLANELAFNIYSWIKEERTIWDKAAQKIRLVKFSDFAVLSRSRGIYADIEEALDRFNIPSIRDKSEDFFTRGEIGDIVCMLRAAADMNDYFAVAGWLMSPFSGASEDDVITKCFDNLTKEKNITEIIKNNLPQTYSRLEYISLIGENESPAGILEIFDKNRNWLSCYDEKDRLRVLRNFRLALAMSRTFQQSGTSSLRACAEWLTRSVKNPVKVEEPKWHDENENAVKLGTVHSSKGLEYPVAVVFDDRKTKKNETNSLRPSRELGLVFSNFPDELETKEELKPKIVKWETLLAEQGDLEEETRLFYVAATRAQDSLIFCGLVDENQEPYKNTWTDFLLSNIEKFDDNEIYLAGGHNDCEIQKTTQKEEKSLTPVNIIPVKNSLRQISASSFSLFEWCPYAWRKRYRQGIELSWEITDKDYDYAGGAELGSLAHWILARWPKFESENFENELEYYLNDREVLLKLPAHIRIAWRDKNKKASLKNWLINFASSDLGVILRHKKDVKRECRFNIRLNKEISMAGAIDAFYDNILIDYKITSVDNAPKELYKSQLDFYALALHELTGYEEINTITAFLREGVFIEKVCNNFDEIKSRVLNASEVCASGPFEPDLGNCVSCPFKI